LLKQELERLIGRGGTVNILFGDDFGATEGHAVEALQLIGANLRYYSATQSFHPKGYIFKVSGRIWAVIGSSNLSASGLRTGTEWCVLLSPEDMNCTSILRQFTNLWDSQYTRTITRDLLEQLSVEHTVPMLNRSLKAQDDYPELPSVERKSEILDGRRNYIVRRQPDNRSSWNFQIYSNKLDERAKKGDFNVVVVCNHGDRNELVFVIPYAYLRDNILPYAHREQRGRYLFEINKQTFRFNWHHSIGMDGKQFRLEGSTESA
jgi:hypothetical protein